MQVRRLRGRLLLVLLVCEIAVGFAAGSEPATITGRVFDVYHRPVPSARVVTMDRQMIDGKARLVPGAHQAVVDNSGTYRLSVPPGRYILAVTPPPRPLDFAAVFPAFLGDIVDPSKAPSVEVRPGELRPFTDFLLLEVQSHRVEGQVIGIPKQWGGAAVILSQTSGYTQPLQVVMTDARGHFQFDHLAAGSYNLQALGPVARIVGLDVIWGHGKSGNAQLDVAAPEITGVRIHLRAAAAR